MEQHKVTEKQKLLNGKGNIAEPGYSTSLVWQYDRADIKAKKIRIKEWDYYIITNQKYALALTLGDEGYVGAISASVIDYTVPFDHTNTAINFFPMGKMNFPATSETGDVEWKNKDVFFSFKNDGKTRRLSGVYPKFGKNKEDLSFDVTLTDFPKDSMVIATPFKKKKHFYYNQKINCMTASGSFKYGDKEYIFDPSDSLGTLDWGRGVWTYDNTWYWGSFQAVLPSGTKLGWNIGYGFGDTSAASENMLFVDGVAHKLSQVTFNIPRDKKGNYLYMQPWTFTSDDKRFEMQFEPILDRQAPLDLKVLAMLPHQVFGYFTGEVVLDDGKKIKVEKMIGFAERVHNKW